ncbi:MAG: fibronectin type III domain-containing protein [Ignavibacteria bacterium]|nr:fibronectin type III domain-containing protein [Ignavibacteria bacterium]
MLKKILYVLISYLVFSQAAFAQVAVNSFTAVQETFTGFAGTADPTNWVTQGYTTWRGTAQTSGTSGGWYGNANMSYLGSGSAGSAYATWKLQNKTGQTITGFTLSFTGRMWKSGSASPSVTVTWANNTSATVPTAGALSNTLSSLTFNDATTGISAGTTLTQTVTNVTINDNDYIYIRFNHSGGSSSDNLGWDDVTFTPSGGVLTAPTTAASAITFSSVTASGLTIGWTSGNGANRIVKVNTSNSFTAPVDATTYTANAIYASGEQTVYNGNGSTASITGLTAGTQYYVTVYEYNGSAGSEKYLTTGNPVNNTSTLAAEPTTNAGAPTFTAISATGFTMNFTSGNGAGRIVLVKSGSAVNSAPVDGTTYTANAAFGSGTQLGTGNYVVYSGTGNSVTVTGLSAATTYYAAVYEFNGSATTTNFYTTTPGTANQITAPAAPTAIAATNVTGGSFSANWNAVTGATGYKIDVATDNGFASLVRSYSDLSTGNVTTYSVSGLDGETQYFYRVRATNAGGASDNSNTIDVTTGSPLASEPTTQAAISGISSVGTTGMTIAFTSGNGAGRIVVMKAGNAVDTDPADGNTYTDNSTFGSGSQLGTGNYVVYQGNANSVVVTGLTAGTTYYIAVYEYNGTTSTINYKATPGTSSQITLCTAPTLSAASLIGGAGFTVNWSAVTGAAGYKLDVCTDNAMTQFVTGYDNLDVTGTSKAVTGLSNATTYYYQLRASNAAGVSANSTVQSVTTFAADPTVQASAITFSNILANSYTITWANGDGANRIVVMKQGSAVSVDPTDGSSYTANAAFGSGSTTGTGNYVIYNGNGNSVTVTGLVKGITYYVAVYEYNGTTTDINYLTPSTATGSKATPALASHIVIAEVYGAGGNSGAAFTNDYVLLYNPTSSPVDVTGWSMQYASATGTSWSSTGAFASATIAKDSYFLIKLGSGGATGSALPTANVNATGINMSATAGKVALCSNSTTLSGATPSSSAIVDLIGFGSNATAYEGSGRATAPSANTDAMRRKDNTGAQNSSSTYFTTGNGWDSDDNANDFFVVTLLTGSLLPVELTSFSVNQMQGHPVLNWSTASEVNNSGFYVVRAGADRMNWQRIDFVAGKGYSNSARQYTYVDKKANAGTYYYRLEQVDNDGKMTPSIEKMVKIEAPKSYELAQNYPNPFNPSTVISYSLPQESKVELRVYSVTGQLMAELVNGTEAAGVHQVSFDGSKLSSGLYIFQLRANGFIQTRKMTLVK